jgi:hypothetical protein
MSVRSGITNIVNIFNYLYLLSMLFLTILFDLSLDISCLIRLRAIIWR